MIHKSVQLLVITFVAVFLLYPRSVDSALDSCSVSISPGSVPPNSSASLSFNISNSASQSIAHVRLISMDAPSFTINSADSGGWSANVENTRIVSFTGGSISAGGSHSFTVNVSTGPETSSAGWLVRASDSGGGENPTDCGGGTSVSIAVPTPTPPSEPTSTSAPGEPTPTPGESTSSDSSDDDDSSSSSSSSSSQSSGPTPTPTPPPDRTPPTVVVYTSFAKPYKEAPVVTGSATDDREVQEVSYSLDGGSNWVPAFVTNAGSATTTFSFRLPNLEDGNYVVSVRARDRTGNTGSRSYGGLVIDKIPPQVGSSLFTLGSHMMYPSDKGTFRSTPGVSSQVILSAIGGALSVELQATSKESNEPQLFPFTRNEKNGLWYGSVDIVKPGIYQLTSKALDGAGNETINALGAVEVLPAGTVSGEDTLAETTLSVFAFEESSKQFQLWDGSDFGQINPQPITDGTYHLILPPGRYYLRIDAAGYRPLETNIVTLTVPTPIIQAFHLEKQQWQLPFGLNLLPFQETTVALDLSLPESPAPSAEVNSLIGKQLPFLSLEMPGSTLTDSSLRGQHTVILLLNTWLPFTAEQIDILSSISDAETNTIVVFPQEHPTAIAQYQARGGYTIPLYADPEGRTITEFGLHAVPTYLFIDKKNTITEVHTGLLDRDGLSARILR